MRTYPTLKQMDLPFAKDIFTNDSITVTCYIKHYPIGSSTQQIS